MYFICLAIIALNAVRSDQISARIHYFTSRNSVAKLVVHKKLLGSRCFKWRTLILFLQYFFFYCTKKFLCWNEKWWCVCVVCVRMEKIHPSARCCCGCLFLIAALAYQSRMNRLYGMGDVLESVRSYRYGIAIAHG